MLARIATTSTSPTAAAGSRVPTLVLHSRRDARVPFDEGRLLAALIPGARFVPLETPTTCCSTRAGVRRSSSRRSTTSSAAAPRGPRRRSAPARHRAERDGARAPRAGPRQRAIARASRQSEKTVRNHITTIFDKLGVRRAPRRSCSRDRRSPARADRGPAVPRCRRRIGRRSGTPASCARRASGATMIGSTLSRRLPEQEHAMQAITAAPSTRSATPRCIEVSKRIRWDIDRDVIRGREFDFSQEVPARRPVAASTSSPSSTPTSSALLSQIQGRTYANMFGLVERFIGAKMLEISRDHWLGDQIGARGAGALHRRGAQAPGAVPPHRADDRRAACRRATASCRSRTTSPRACSASRPGRCSR